MEPVEGYSCWDSVYTDLREEGREALAMKASDYFVPDFVSVFGGVGKGEDSRC